MSTNPSSKFLEYSMLLPHMLMECRVPSGVENTKRATQLQPFVSRVVVSLNVRQIVGAVLATITFENPLVWVISSVVDC